MDALRFLSLDPEIWTVWIDLEGLAIAERYIK